jgi:hypothetical protein
VKKFPNPPNVTFKVKGFPIWDDAIDAPIGTDGRPALVGFLGSRGQAERWQALGFDIPQAVDRYNTFSLAWELAKTEAKADALVTAFYADERQFAILSGITEADPDFWRFAAAPKHYEFA